MNANKTIIREEPEKYAIFFGIAVIPFFLMSLISILIFYLGNDLSANFGLLFTWLGISIAAHSFPNIKIGATL